MSAELCAVEQTTAAKLTYHVFPRSNDDRERSNVTVVRAHPQGWECLDCSSYYEACNCRHVKVVKRHRAEMGLSRVP